MSGVDPILWEALGWSIFGANLLLAGKHVAAKDPLAAAVSGFIAGIVLVAVLT